MKIVSWNVNSLNVRMPHLREYLERAQPDIVALQETKMENGKFPQSEISKLGYESVFSGQKTYNGVAILAHSTPSDVVTDIANLDDPQRRILAATVGDLRIVNLYVVNGQSVGSDKFAYKLNWLAQVREFLRDEMQRHANVVVLGDFNIAPADRDVHDPVAWRESVLCSTPEREALQQIFDLGLYDSYRLFEQVEAQYSWWDYRQAAFRRNLGLRIDLILISAALRSRCRSASIDRLPRTLDRPSDHAPVVLEIE